ncbi:MAG: hypothetical protein A4S12_07350 [Proteobacteria bacterium SG_bin5]|nr:hypothetical protein [Sphingomonas sp.]OQW42011.1 MAG: hypothetical protein A4S12_07350 [Proteobacteria bacterium SG_bin5]
MKKLIAASAALSLIALPTVATAAPGASAAAPLSLANAAPVRAAPKGGKAKVSNAGIAVFAVLVVGGAVAALAVIAGTRDQGNGNGVPVSR